MPNDYDGTAMLHGLARQAQAWSRPFRLDPSSAPPAALDRLVAWWSRHRDPLGVPATAAAVGIRGLLAAVPPPFHGVDPAPPGPGGAPPHRTGRARADR
ncbi:hypothetical protein [Kitasatospora sp. HPMI-4]|uniref:hypothetical protein n=1 Tax=Kitasatospora sp. HPMI-4 TaxID=3448443 RepID=UPI003F1A4216